MLRLTYLASMTRLAVLPAAVAPTAAHERRIATKHDVQDDTQAPQVAAFIIDGGFLVERLNYLRRHVFGRTTLQRTKKKKKRKRSNAISHCMGMK